MYHHSIVHIVRIDDVVDGQPRTWFVGPYGLTAADQTARELESIADAGDAISSRTCTVEELFSNDECLNVVNETGRPIR